MERIAEFIGASIGMFMRAVDWISGRRKTWGEEIPGGK